LFVSAMEGILFNIKQCYDILTALSGRPKMIMVSGGISKSPMWIQMLSDILEETVYRTDMEQSSLIGGALMAAAALDIDVDLNTVNHAEESIMPNLEAIAICRKRYERYLSLYGTI